MSAHLQKSRQEAQKHVKLIQDAWKWCQQSIARSQERQQIQANKHRRPVDWDVGDKVWVATKNWASNRPSKKLGYQNDGPYQVVEKVGHSYKIAIPGEETRTAHPAEVLRKDPGNPLPGQRQEEAAPVIYGTQPEWEVEEILNSRVFSQRL